MLIATLQALLTAAACFGLWRFLRALRGRGLTSHIIVVGFLLRAVAGQLLFWISWLRLPLGRSLQLGNGLWFFAIDGQWYLAYADELLSKGAKAVLLVDASYPSHIFVQCLTLFTAAFGLVASTAILLNCAAYVATCALIVRIAPPAAERARTFTLAAVAFGPATFLWSLQPLKDTFFLLLITAMIALGHEWQNLWRNANPVRRSIVCAAAMCVTVYAIAGTRWYVGAVIALASVVFLPLVANLPRPRLAASVVAVVLLVAFGEAFLIGGSLDLPNPVRQMLAPGLLLRTRVEKTGDLLATTRRGFETTHGGTSILPGAALLPAGRKIATTNETKPAIANTMKQAATPVQPKGTSAPARTAPSASPVAVSTPPVPAAGTPSGSAAAPVIAATPAHRDTVVAAPVVAEKRTPIAAPAVATTSTHAAAPSSVASTPATARTGTATPASAAPAVVAAKTAPVATGTAAPAVGDVNATATRAPEASPIPPPAVTASAPAMTVRKETHYASARRREPAVVTTPLPHNARQVSVAVVPPKPVPPELAPQQQPPQPQPQQPPQPTLAAKITSGLAAMFLPRAVAQRAGLVKIGGGRGFWFFADADTVVFDLVILAAFGYCVRQLARNRRRATPLFILVTLIFLAICGPMIYTVTNFGTLFRLRQMLYVLAALLPITLDLPERER